MKIVSKRSILLVLKLKFLSSKKVFFHPHHIGPQNKKFIQLRLTKFKRACKNNLFFILNNYKVERMVITLSYSWKILVIPPEKVSLKAQEANVRLRRKS